MCACAHVRVIFCNFKRRSHFYASLKRNRRQAVKHIHNRPDLFVSVLLLFFFRLSFFSAFHKFIMLKDIRDIIGLHVVLVVAFVVAVAVAVVSARFYHSQFMFAYYG